MGLAPAEERAQRAITKAFIVANFSDLVLIPRSPQRDGNGTKWVDGTARGVQRLRVIDQSSTSGPTPGLLRGADGVQRLVVSQLLGEWDAEIGLYDRWTDVNGLRNEVAEILPYNGYERRAQVVRYGES